MMSALFSWKGWERVHEAAQPGRCIFLRVVRSTRSDSWRRDDLDLHINLVQARESESAGAGVGPVVGGGTGSVGTGT